jgi:hypothetical protein
MTNANTITGKTLYRVVGLIAALAITLVATRAHAGVGISTVQSVEYTWNDTLLIQQPGPVNFHAFKNDQPGCAGWVRSVDVLKAWQSLAQSALLARKTVQIYYDDTCSGQPGVKFITSIILVN